MNKKHKLATGNTTDPVSNEQLLEYWAWLDRATFTIVKARDKELRKYGLSFIQGKVLLSLKILDYAPTIGELSRWLFREHCSISGITDRMMRRQLIKKYRDTTKKNITRIALTEAGEKAYHDMAKRESLLNILSVLSRDQCHQLGDCLKTTLDRALNLDNAEYCPDISQTIVGWFSTFLIRNESKMISLPDTSFERVNRSRALLDIINSYCPPAQLVTWIYMDHSSHAITRIREKELEKLGLSIVQSKILDVLKTLKYLPTVGELAKLINRDHNSISGITDRMGKKGLLRKYRDPVKKHLTRIELTENGEQTYRSLVNRKSITNILSFMTPDDCKNNVLYLKKLLDRAQRELKSET